MVGALIALLVVITIGLVLLEVAAAGGILGMCALSLFVLTLLARA